MEAGWMREADTVVSSVPVDATWSPCVLRTAAQDWGMLTSRHDITASVLLVTSDLPDSHFFR